MTPSAEQLQFADSLHELLAAAQTPSMARAWGRGEHHAGLALWRRLGTLGVTALAVPESHGGLGAGATDLVVTFEELGHHAVPGPLIESIAVAPLLAEPAWLPKLASGDAIATVGPSFLDADIADLVLGGKPGDLATGIDPTRRLFPTDLSARIDPTQRPFPGDLPARIDPARRLFPGLSIGLDQTQQPAPGGLSTGIDQTERSTAGETGVGAASVGLPEQAFNAGALACAAQLLGLGRALLEMSVSYAKSRVQFGQPIGRFQATKHRLADVLIAHDFARPLLYAAAASGSARDISAAKVACGDAAYLAARSALQVHGAIGYTDEFDLSIWFTKVRALVPAWGTPAEHRARVMAAL